jgi:DnaJ-class molecular chaperone
VVNIPAGIESGKNIRLKGLGNPGSAGVSPGDLYLKINVAGHHFFLRQGLDIHCRIPITIDQAVNGAKIRVRTILDKKIDLKIPAGTKSGAKFRLKGYGLSLNSQKGDQIVEIEIKVPEKMTPEEKRKFDEMAEKVGLKK